MGAAAWLTYTGAYAVCGRNIIAMLLALAAAVAVYAVMLFGLKILNEEEIKMLPGGSRLYGLLAKTKLYK